jgi:hypothetical protein
LRTRAVREVLFGFALYQRQGNEGLHVGLTDQQGAFDWLSGKPLDEIDHFVLEKKAPDAPARKDASGQVT